MASLFSYISTLETQGGPEVENTYHGKPCKRCGGTVRDSRSCSCIACKNKPKKERINTGERIQGRPCKKCGGTERYKSDHTCVACKHEKNRLLIEKRRAASALIPKKKPGDQRCLSCGQTKNYFFLDYCRGCVAAEKNRVPEKHKTFTRCDWCGEWKPYRITEACRACEAANKRHRLEVEAMDKLKALEEARRRYSDPF